MSLKKFLLAALLCASVVPAQDVMISEIMYNPDSSEANPNDSEWLEIYNYGTTTVDISGWYLEDEDGATAAFPAMTFIAPGEAIVICPDIVTVTDFQAAWGVGFQILPVGGFYFGSATGIFGTDLGGLSNSPGATNEVLTLKDAAGMLVDEANFDDAAPWPVDSPDGPSIYVLPQFLDTNQNDNGANWARSTDTVDGAFFNTQTAIFGGVDTGSPGVVAFNPTAPFGVNIAHIAATNSVDINIVSGTPNNLFQIFASFSNTGVAPNGGIFGVQPTIFEIQQQLFTAPWFGSFSPSGDFLLSFPGVPVPLGVAIDYVAVDVDPATGNIVQVTPAIAGGI